VIKKTYGLPRAQSTIRNLTAHAIVIRMSPWRWFNFDADITLQPSQECNLTREYWPYNVYIWKQQENRSEFHVHRRVKYRSFDVLPAKSSVANIPNLDPEFGFKIEARAPAEVKAHVASL
jgi:hypothetical protein